MHEPGVQAEGRSLIVALIVINGLDVMPTN